jgi:hypothetical protein
MLTSFIAPGYVFKGQEDQVGIPFQVVHSSGVEREDPPPKRVEVVLDPETLKRFVRRQDLLY